jgi:hypothetical protein
VNFKVLISNLQNPFDLLGNDVEDASIVPVVPKEVVKKNTSSKKADVPPASADPSRSKGGKKPLSGNEAALKDKSAGRSSNRNQKVDDKASQRKSKPRTDRQARSFKSDSEKKVKQAGWTADGESELAAETAPIAEDGEEAPAASEEPKEAKKSYADYLAEQSANAAKPAAVARAIEGVNEEDIIVKTQESFIEATKTKNTKAKAQKTKTFFEFEALTPEQAPRERAPRDNRAPRGGRAPARGGKGARAPKDSKPKGPQFNESNFPSL